MPQTPPVSLNEVSADELNKALPPLTKENKMWVLLSLGFVPNGKGRWVHPVLLVGESKVLINFDVETDDLAMIINKIYKRGWQIGQSILKNSVMQALHV